MLGLVLQGLADAPELHSKDLALYRALEALIRKEVVAVFGPNGPQVADLGPFGRITLPYLSMGAIDSTHLFGLDELIIFSFYFANRNRYRTAVDAGANIGLHSIMMSRCGFRVRCYEPDPEHFQVLERNLALNNCEFVEALMAALSTSEGQHDFVRVGGNTTGSYLAGAKSGTYGPVDVFPVRTVSFAEAISDVDLVKVDVEGHEADILDSTPLTQWSRTDAIVEVGNETNAARIYTRFRGTSVNLFVQKLGWARATRPEDMPKSYRDGSLFISARGTMPWGQALDMPRTTSMAPQQS
jgi:FkbM family methyltransferase